jgi:regulator of sigma E protease
MQLIIFMLGLLLFIGLVLVHEWGHFFAARRNGVFVEEYGLGFPPALWSKKLKSGMHLSINWLPLGGFVRMRGEHDSDTRKGSFGAASLWAKSKIMLAGVFMYLLVAVFIFMILALIGIPKIITKDAIGQDQFTVASDTKITHQSVLAGAIIQNTPASRLGLSSTDTILSIQGAGRLFNIKTSEQLHKATLALAGQEVKITYQKVNSKESVTKTTKLLSLNEIISDLKNQAHLNQADKVKQVYDPNIKNPSDRTMSVNSDTDFYNAGQSYFGDKVTITYLRNGQEQTSQAVLQPQAYLGISPNQIQIQRSTWSAPIVAIGLTKQITVLTFQGLGKAIAGLGSLIAGTATGNSQARENGQTQAGSQVGGPVAIMKVLWSSGALGWVFMLMIIAVISLTLAIMNILPIPALDGGRLAMMLFSRGILKRPFSKQMEERIVGATMALLLLLIAVITVVDVKRYF